jgi:redox-regulated HSP33 family molecular chaperone
VDFYLDAGVTGMTILGIMGEAPKLSGSESVVFLRRVLARVADRIPVVVGVSGAGLTKMAALAHEAMAAGARLHGLLLAAKHDGRREVYRGVTPVDHASVIGALRCYMRDSAQLHGVLLCAVTVGADGRVLRAAGALIERLPPSGDLPSLDAEAFAARFAALERDGEEAAVQALLDGDLGGERVAILEQRPVFWGCSCSRGRVLDALSGLAPDELRSMADVDGGAKVDCHFCNASYALTAAELRELADAAEG